MDEFSCVQVWLSVVGSLFLVSFSLYAVSSCQRFIKRDPQQGHTFNAAGPNFFNVFGRALHHSIEIALAKGSPAVILF